MGAPGGVVVIGAGAIGLAAAWRCRSRGMDVTVLDPAPASGATWAAAGMLAPVTEARYGEDDLLDLNLESARRYPAFVAELEQASRTTTHYRRSGTLLVARDADDNAALEEVFAFQRELGLEASRLRGRECVELEPGLAPSTRGGVLVEGDHQVDNRALARALLSACELAGVRIIEEPVVGVQVSGGAVTGVSTATGEVEAEAVVLAAGCRSGQIEGLPPEAVPPVRPVKGQLLHLRTPHGLPVPASRNIRGLEVYVVPRADGRVVVGATVEERGFEETATAGAVLELLRAAYELLPGITELELTETAVGLRPGSPDNAPLVGLSALQGLVVATGHYRNGVLLTPVTADAVADLVTTGSVPAVVEPFSPRRFSGERTHAGG